MKYELSQRPECFKETWPGQFQTFSWVEFAASIPQAISVITTWKEGKIPNACLQSWTMYTGDAGGYYVIFSIMNTNHTYKNILRTKEFVVNFPSSDEFKKCYDTIKNNADKMDEITASGLTVEPGRVVDAPRIKECFLNLECKLAWHKPLHKGSIWHLFAGEVVHAAIDSENAGKGIFARCGAKGFIYNIHSPIDPETGQEDDSMVGIIEPVFKM
jgi:flavin reductase (DIM6/NTAB) family NADH-FMN oxidoreductase RutF